MNPAIQMIEAEITTLEAQYDSIVRERYLALKFGTTSKKLLAELKHREDLALAKYETLRAFRITLKYELEKFAVAE